MFQFTRITLLLGMAASLTAQTLSFGEITLVTPATTPPTYVVNLVLSTANTTYATAPNQVAGFQFDVNYDPTKLNVTIGSPLSNFQVNPTCLGPTSFAGCKSLATYNPSTTAPMNNGGTAGGGQRAIVIGCCATGQTTPTSNTIADGAVATLTVQPVAALTASQTLTLLNQVGTTQGGASLAAATVPLTIGAGAGDPGATGILDMYKLYLVGGVYGGSGDSAPGFGSGAITLNDVLNTLFAFDNLNVPGYTAPVCGTDRFDAMNTYQQDTVTTRGGSRTGKLSLNDVLTNLFMFDNLTGYQTRPVRISAPYTCPVPGGGSAPASISGASARVAVRTPPEVTATLVFGPREAAGTGQERIPVYLDSRRDLHKLAMTFSAGDQQSKWQFQAVSAVAPTVLQDSTTGVAGALAVAWLRGFDIGAGRRLLLGYIVGPSGSAGNLRILAMGASLIDGLQEVGLDVSGVTVAQQ